jgi:hypothetical protein
LKEFFVSKRFSADKQKMIEEIEIVLDRYEAQGYDLTLRQLYYQLLTKNLYKNSDESYKWLGGLVTDARLAGLLDWDMIKDRGRVCNELDSWQTGGEFMRVAPYWYMRDRWENQPVYVEVMVEKDALSGILLPKCQELDVPFTANKGYCSVSAMYEAGKRIREELEKGKRVVVLYLGDHDPSGLDMSRDVQERLTLFSGVEELRTSWDDGEANFDMITFPEEHPFADSDAFAGPIVHVDRLALNRNQVDEFGLESNPAKLKDKRSAKYIAKFGRESWELDAIEPSVLTSLVDDRVRLYRHEETLDIVLAKENRTKTALFAFGRTFVEPIHPEEVDE